MNQAAWPRFLKPLPVPTNQLRSHFCSNTCSQGAAHTQCKTDFHRAELLSRTHSPCPALLDAGKLEPSQNPWSLSRREIVTGAFLPSIAWRLKSLGLMVHPPGGLKTEKGLLTKRKGYPLRLPILPQPPARGPQQYEFVSVLFILGTSNL